jgi:hypothetical protein
MVPPGLSKSMQTSSSVATAIANFKPSPREVISGIAPHVFDERQKRRRRSLRRSSRHFKYAERGSPCSSSPLRCSAVIALDNGSMIILGTHCIVLIAVLFSHAVASTGSDLHPNVKEPTLNDNQPAPIVHQSLCELEPKLDTEKSAWRSTLLRCAVIFTSLSLRSAHEREPSSEPSS